MTESFIDPVKRCACCKKYKAATYEFFYKAGNRLSSYCKECQKQYLVSYKKLNISEVIMDGVANINTKEIDFEKQPDIAELFEETKRRQEEIKKLKELDGDQLNLVINI